MPFLSALGWIGGYRLVREGSRLFMRRWLLSLVLVAGSLWCLGLVWHVRQSVAEQSDFSARPVPVTRDAGGTHEVFNRTDGVDGRGQG